MPFSYPPGGIFIYFQRMNHVCLNGKIIPAGGPVLRADNKSFRYGDGLFETMKLGGGKIILAKYHFQRLFSGIRLLQFRIPPSLTASRLQKEILALCNKNHCSHLARIRLAVFRGNGGLRDASPHLQYLIECQPGDPAVNAINKKGWTIDIYPDARKSCDLFCNLKSANYLPYVMASQYAGKKKHNDSLVTNTAGNIADATTANIFLVKNNLVITPALTEGCIKGVMRRYLIEKLSKSANFEVREGVVTKNDLETFTEVFLTNAIYGIRWVQRFREKTYTNTQTLKIYSDFITPLFS